MEPVLQQVVEMEELADQDLGEVEQMDLAQAEVVVEH
jgi:hypothetical protein